jgi:L-amino acid N-acyltransferase YncA
MALIIRPALASDAKSIGNLARQFASYLSELGDLTAFKLTADAYVRDGFGSKPAFAGLVAEDQGKVIGYLLYQKRQRQKKVELPREGQRVRRDFEELLQ